jgi:hypothetical protein
MVILFVGFEMLGQRVDAGCQDSDLNFGGSCVALFRGVFLDELFFQRRIP